MANPIGKFTAALVTAQNENSLSLASLNLDFTLVKLEAPAESKGLGMMISKQRKKDAADGTLHKCARKLGALLEAIFLSPPSCFKHMATGSQISLHKHQLTHKEYKDETELLRTTLELTPSVSGPLSLLAPEPYSLVQKQLPYGQSLSRNKKHVFKTI
jgi:hypothetical protein